MKKNVGVSIAVIVLVGLLLCNVDFLLTTATTMEQRTSDVTALSGYPGKQYRRGDKDENVSQIQRMLNRIAEEYPEVPTVKPDGVFGEETENAVKAFQTRFSLKVDGIVGPETWQKLEQICQELDQPEETEPTQGDTRQTLRKGSKGDDVKALQTKLNLVAQYYSAVPTVKVDGDFGSSTENAVKKFQSTFGLSVDGVVGKATWAKLDQLCGELEALENNGDEHYIADPERLSQVTFPQNWSEKALKFAVGNGILNGKGDSLAPGENTTRAEAAAILVRLLNAGGQAKTLSGYTDVKQDAWYYEELSAAVTIGLVNGTSATTLSPNDPITREQACTMLSRAFGLYPEDDDYCDRFLDSEKISAYARPAISAMAEKEYLTGYYDGTVRPKANITRAELSKLIYEMVTHICDDPDELPKSGRVLYRGSKAIPEGYTLYGDLTIGCGMGKNVSLKNVSVSGAMTLRTVPNAKVSLKTCSVGSLSVPTAVELHGDTTVSRLITAGKNSSLEIAAEEVQVYGDCALADDADRVECRANGIHATLTANVGNLQISGDDVHAEVNGKVENCRIDGDRAVVDGLGKVNKIEVYGKDSKVSCSYTELNNGNVPDDYEDALKIVKTVDNWNSFKADEPYSAKTLEGFVDQKGYSSSTGYLLWVSTKTLTVNLFKGSKGNWTLVRSMSCALGKPSTPTIKGEFAVYDKDPTWYYDGYNCRWVTKFCGGYAFHSRLWKPDYSELVDPSINCLVSKGCVRMYDEDCSYIYKNVPLNTTVVVY